MSENQLEMLALPLGKGAAATTVALLLPDKTSIEQWADIGKVLNRATEKLSWWLADWAAFGDRKFGELKEFCELNGVNYGTLRNLAWVSNSVHLSRRRDNLSFKHHVEVAALGPKQQKRFLRIAAAENLSCADLRARIRKAQAEFGPEKTYGPSAFTVEKFFLDGEVFLQRNVATVNESRDYYWQKAEPMLRKAAEIWPERVVVK